LTENKVQSPSAYT